MKKYCGSWIEEDLASSSSVFLHKKESAPQCLDRDAPIAKQRFFQSYGLPADESGDGGAEGGFENGGFAVGEWDGDFADGFVGGDLS